jgi:anti-anti-sigma regulatory factor
MTENKTIDVAAIVAPVLASRDLISTLKNEIEKTAAKQVQLDFSNVEFVSRSAAHELLRLKETITAQASKISIEFINANDEVARMLRTVASNRAIPKDAPDTSSIKTVSIDDLELSPSPFRFFKRLFAN